MSRNEAATLTPALSREREREKKPRKATRWLTWLAGALALIAATAFAAHSVAWQSGLTQLRADAQHRLDMVGTGLDGELARFDYLPSLLEMTPQVQRLLASPADPALRDDVNRTLRGINATAGADMLYVIDRSGMALAAADWDQPGTPVGMDLSFRPYVQDALAAGRGRFYGIGVTSGRPGYYLSFALTQQGRALGVATVKVSLEQAEKAWRKLPGNVLLADERGVVILSTHEAWKFRPLQPLGADTLAHVARTRPYGRAELQPLEWRTLDMLAGDTQLVSVGATRYLATNRLLNQAQWRLIVLDDVAPLQAAARNAALIAALGSSVLLLIAIALWQRRRALHLQLASRMALQTAFDSLEAKVIERTAELRATQTELVHAGKMAVLGQMSAGLVHELNQPLAAMRTLSDNAVVLLEQGRLPEVQANLDRVAHLVDRLGKLTWRLKAFAHKADVPPVPVPVRQALANAQFTVSQRLREHGVELSVLVEPPELAALAEEVRLEQVLTNLLGNAIDAMAHQPTRRLMVQAGAAAGRCTITVQDTGPGIRADILPRLFEPFTTSKPAGAGLGLGLMISAHIARELGGHLQAHNLEGGGACFTLDLPLPETP
jgi:two-component system C4-dicarboxylate transport sensor histidine kinase DctB